MPDEQVHVDVSSNGDADEAAPAPVDSPSRFVPTDDVPAARPVSVQYASVSPREMPLVGPREAIAGVLSTALIGATTLIGLSILFFGALRLIANTPLDLSYVPEPIFWIVFKWTAAAMTLGGLLMLARWQALPLRTYGIRGDGLHWQVLLSVPALLGTYAAMFCIAIFILMATIGGTGAEQDIQHRIDYLSQLPQFTVLQTLLMMSAVALHEELLFRGMLIPYLRGLGIGRWGAVAVSSMIFGILHFEQGWTGIVQISCIGAVLGSVFVLTRSLLTVVLAHFLFDFFQVLLIQSLPLDQLIQDLEAMSETAALFAG